MSYTKHNWVTGEVITASKLNNLENGVANAGGYDLVFRMNDERLNVASSVTVESGSYAAAAAKFNNGGFATALAYGNRANGDAMVYTPLWVTYNRYAEGDPEILAYLNNIDYERWITLTSDGTASIHS